MVKPSQSELDQAVAAVERLTGRTTPQSLTPTIRKLTPCPIAAAFNYDSKMDERNQDYSFLVYRKAFNHERE